MSLRFWGWVKVGVIDVVFSIIYIIIKSMRVKE